MSYKLLSYFADRKEIRAGILVDDHVYDAARVGTDTSYATMDGVLRNWKKAHSAFVAGTKNIESGKSRASSAKLARRAAIIGAGSSEAKRTKAAGSMARRDGVARRRLLAGLHFGRQLTPVVQIQSPEHAVSVR